MFLEKNLKYLKTKKNLSFTGLAKISKLPKRTLEDIYYGKAIDPRLSTLIKLADYFNITLDQLIKEDLEALEEPNN